MTNSKKRLFIVFALVLVLCCSAIGLVACGNNDKPASVSFMVQNADGEWEVLEKVTAVDGKVKADKIPVPAEKKYYDFSGWFMDKKDLNTAFGNKNIEGNIKVYAKYSPIEVNVFMDNQSKGAMHIKDVVEKNANITVADGLTFDGWFTDEACKVQWNGESREENLYARSVAVVKFSNGWAADDYSIKVVPGSKINPATDEVTLADQTKTTFEKAYLVKNYMSPLCIDYVNGNGAAIDFNKAIDKNTTITVKWSSKIGDSSYELNEKTGKYTIKLTTDMDFDKAPILSFRSVASIMEKDVAKKIEVEAIDVQTINFIPSTVSKIIFEEGIKAIKGVNGDGACPVEEVILPASAKIVDNSFNNMPNLKKVVIPEGVEVIISSFFNAGGFEYQARWFGTVHNFDITIPASVKNMAMVPNNFKFAEGSSFSKDANGCIIKTEGTGETAKKVLVSDPQAYAAFDDSSNAIADTIVVPECDYIQAGTYNTIFNYLILPSTFAGIRYNVNLADHDYYSAYTNNILYDAASMADPLSTMNANAFAITNYVGGFKMSADQSGTGDYMWEIGAGKLVFTAAKPSDLNNFAFVGDDMGFRKYKPMDNATVATSIIVKDNANKAYISVEYANQKLVAAMGFGTRVNSTVVETSPLTKDDVIAKLVAVKYGEELTAAMDGNEVKFYANNKEITLGEVKGNMFITAKIIESPKLIIKSSYRLSCDDNGDVSDNPASYTQDCIIDYWMEPSAEVTAKLTDLTGLSKETVMNAVLDAAVKAALWTSGDEAVVKANIKWSYDNAISLKIMMDGKEVTDYSKINLDNGSVNLEVVVEYQPYATQA